MFSQNMNFNKLGRLASKFFFGSALGLVVFMTGCGGGGGGATASGPTGTLTAITVTPGNASIGIGSTVTLKALGSYSNGGTGDITAQVTWTPSSSVINVKAGGVVTGVSVGAATITASLSGITSAAVNVAVTLVGGSAAANHLNYARYEQTANLILAGTSGEAVLVAGGWGPDSAGNTVALNSAELYDPTTNTWTITSSLATVRGDHTSTQLANGQVLLIGGADTSLKLIANSELYIPNTGWVAADSLLEGRSYHTSTLLLDGTTVLAVGGGGNASPNLASSELYDSIHDKGGNKGTWKATGSLNEGRNTHTATLLTNGTNATNGKVLVVGGFGGVVNAGPGVVASVGKPLASAELYDPNHGTWTTTGSLHTGRYEHTATLLTNGKILVIGGFDSNDTALGTAELYDPLIGTWTVIGNLNTARAGHTATLLGTGKVLVMGGETSRGVETKSTELFDPATGISIATADLNAKRDAFTATLLTNGKVLVAAGTDETSAVVALDSSELY